MVAVFVNVMLLTILTALCLCDDIQCSKSIKGSNIKHNSSYLFDFSSFMDQLSLSNDSDALYITLSACNKITDFDTILRLYNDPYTFNDSTLVAECDDLCMLNTDNECSTNKCIFNKLYTVWDIHIQPISYGLQIAGYKGDGGNYMINISYPCTNGSEPIFDPIIMAQTDVSSVDQVVMMLSIVVLSFLVLFCCFLCAYLNKQQNKTLYDPRSLVEKVQEHPIASKRMKLFTQLIIMTLSIIGSLALSDQLNLDSNTNGSIAIFVGSLTLLLTVFKWICNVGVIIEDENYQLYYLGNAIVYGTFADCAFDILQGAAALNGENYTASAAAVLLSATWMGVAEEIIEGIIEAMHVSGDILSDCNEKFMKFLTLFLIIFSTVELSLGIHLATTYDSSIKLFGIFIQLMLLLVGVIITVDFLYEIKEKGKSTMNWLKRSEDKDIDQDGDVLSESSKIITVLVWISRFMPFAAAVFCLGYIIVLLSNPANWSTDPNSQDSDIFIRESNRGVFSRMMIAMILVPVEIFMFYVKVKETLVIIKYGFILGPVIGYLLDQAIGLDAGFRDVMTSAGFSFTFSSLIGGNFMRFIVTMALDLFISNPLQDFIKAQVKKIGVIERLRNPENKRNIFIKYDYFIAYSYPAILQSLVSFITFNVYNHQTRFSWAYPSLNFDRDFRIPPGTICLATATAAVLYVKFYTIRDYISERDYFGVNDKLGHVFIVLLILYGLNETESIEAPVANEVDTEYTKSIESAKPYLGMIVFTCFVLYGFVYPVWTRLGCYGHCKPKEAESNEIDHMHDSEVQELEVTIEMMNYIRQEVGSALEIVPNVDDEKQIAAELVLSEDYSDEMNYRVQAQGEAVSSTKYKLILLWIFRLIPIVSSIIALCYMISLMATTENWRTNISADDTEKLTRENNREECVFLLISILINIIGSYMFYIKVREALVIINFGFIFGGMIRFMLNQAISSDYGLANVMTSAGFAYTFSSLVSGNFMRIIVTIFIDLFISNPLQDIVKNRIRKVGIIQKLTDTNGKKSILKRYDTIVAVIHPAFVQYIVGIITFYAYSNRLQWQWADANYTLDQEFRIPPGTIMLSTAITGVLFLNFYTIMDYISEREYFDVNTKFRYILIAFGILYILNQTSTIEAPIQGKNDLLAYATSMEDATPYLGIIIFICFAIYGVVYPLQTQLDCCRKSKESASESASESEQDVIASDKLVIINPQLSLIIETEIHNQIKMKENEDINTHLTDDIEIKSTNEPNNMVELVLMDSSPHQRTNYNEAYSEKKKIIPQRKQILFVWLFRIFVVLVAGYLFIYIVYLLADADNWSTNTNSEMSAIFERESNRRNFVEKVMYSLFLFIFAFMFYIKVRESLVVVNYGFILVPMVIFSLDLAIGADYGFINFMTSAGFSYTFSILISGHFGRFLITMALDMFISNPLLDIVKHRITKTNVIQLLINAEDKTDMLRKYDGFVAQNIPSLLQITLLLITHGAYINLTRFAWAYSNIDLDRAFRINPATVGLFSIIAGVSYLIFYTIMDYISDREYFNINVKLGYVFVVLTLLYVLSVTEAMEAPIANEVDIEYTKSIESGKPYLGMIVFICFVLYGFVYPIWTRMGCCGHCQPKEAESNETDHLAQDVQQLKVTEEIMEEVRSYIKENVRKI